MKCGMFNMETTNTTAMVSSDLTKLIKCFGKHHVNLVGVTLANDANKSGKNVGDELKC